MAILELVLSATYMGQRTINRFNYVSTGTPASVSLSFALAYAFGAIYVGEVPVGAYPSGTPMKAIANLISNSLVFDNVLTKDIASVTDFYSTPFIPAYTGGYVGDGASPALAFGFLSNRVRSDIKSGQKRFPGVTEEIMGVGGVVGVAAGSLMALAADAMSAVLTYDDEGNTLSFTPAICSLERYEVERDGIPTGRFAYRYYEDPAEQLAHTAVGVTWSPKGTVRTQVSRQYGRGQ